MKFVPRNLILPLVLVFAETAFSSETTVMVAREVPVPAAASPELRRSILETPSIVRLEPPATRKEWLQVQEKRNKERAANVPAIASALKVQIQRKKIAGVAVTELTAATIKAANRNRLFVHLHGGAYVFGRGDAGLTEGLIIANRLGIPVLSVDYRMPPRAPFPAAIDDVVAVYRRLLKDHKAESLVIGGTSAGGGLAFASVHKFRQLNLPVPGAVYGGTPWADLTKTGDTLFTHEGLDRILDRYDGLLEASAMLYAAGHDLKDELISPVYGDFEGFPPAFLVTGTRDLFLSDVARIHRKLRGFKVDADLHVYEGMSHAGYLVVANSPESIDMFNELRRFVDEHLAE
jgi:epsilon-lactone hydrolase